MTDAELREEIARVTKRLDVAKSPLLPHSDAWHREQADALVALVVEEVRVRINGVLCLCDEADAAGIASGGFLTVDAIKEAVGV